MNSKKIKIIVLCILVICSITLKSNAYSRKFDIVGASSSETKITKLEIIDENPEVKVGEYLGLTKRITPATAINEEVIWTSSNELIATVSQTGVVKGIKEGTAIITVKTPDESLSYSKAIKVTANDSLNKISKLEIVNENPEVKVGEYLGLTKRVTPAAAINEEVIWTSSNELVATVSQTGVVKGIKEGTAIVTVKTPDGSVSYSKEIKVIVNNNSNQQNNTDNNNSDSDQQNNTNHENSSFFNDVSKLDWYYDAVNYVYINNIIKGYNSTTFAPNDNLTRGMLVTILYRMDGSPNNDGNSKFSDVESNIWYSKAIKWAVDNGVVHGYAGTNNFGPNDNIIRQDLAGILRNYAKYKNKDIYATSGISRFKDYKLVDSYAKTAMQWAVSKGVITGYADGTLNPKGTATRAETAAMIQKYCNKVGR